MIAWGLKRSGKTAAGQVVGNNLKQARGHLGSTLGEIGKSAGAGFEAVTLRQESQLTPSCRDIFVPKNLEEKMAEIFERWLRTGRNKPKRLKLKTGALVINFRTSEEGSVASRQWISSESLWRWHRVVVVGVEGDGRRVRLDGDGARVVQVVGEGIRTLDVEIVSLLRVTLMTTRPFFFFTRTRYQPFCSNSVTRWGWWKIAQNLQKVAKLVAKEIFWLLLL